MTYKINFYDFSLAYSCSVFVESDENELFAEIEMKNAFDAVFKGNYLLAFQKSSQSDPFSDKVYHLYNCVVDSTDLDIKSCVQEFSLEIISAGL